MSKPSLVHTVALIACISIITTPTVAHFHLGPGFPDHGLGFPGGDLKFLGGGLGLPDIKQCLISIVGVPGCFQGLIFSVFSGQYESIDDACCKAFLEVNEACWPKELPINPTFPQDLRNYCENAEDSPPTSPGSSDDDTDRDEDGDCDDNNSDEDGDCDDTDSDD